MKSSDYAKRQQGFGDYIEVPVPVYCMGVILGLLDPFRETLYYVLPEGQEDQGKNYVRCRGWRPEKRVYLVPPSAPQFKQWIKGSESVIPADQAQRVVQMHRGMIMATECGQISGDASPYSPDWTNACRLFLAYVVFLSESVRQNANWNLLIEQWAAKKRIPAFVEILDTGWLEPMDMALEDMFTKMDASPLTEEV